MHYGIRFDSAIGEITIIGKTDNRISSIEIGRHNIVQFSEPENAGVLLLCKTQLEEYFSGQRKSFEIPLDWDKLTGFQADVLRMTQKIPFGEVCTYGEIARELGKPAASRAVGRALATNPLPILIPCHRVVAATGHLTGFSAANGIISKTWLLQLEGHRIVAEKLA